MEQKDQITQTQGSGSLVSVDINQFFEMIQYLQKHSLVNNLHQYLKSNSCNNVIMDTKALILFKKFIKKEGKVDTQTNFLLTDWCPCVKDAQ